MRTSVLISRGKNRGSGAELAIEAGIFASRSGFVGNGREGKKRCYPAGVKGGEVISFQLVLEFYLPYAGYRVYRR